MGIRIARITQEIFNEHSLDDFIRHQIVSECWRNIDGKWELLPITFTEEWNVERCQEEARDILTRINSDMIAFGAYECEKVIGYITILTKRIGNRNQYVQLYSFEVSEPYRGKGIGRQLFVHACDAAKQLGARKLYISAHSSKESQAAYQAFGCEHAEEIISWIADEEPCDVQLEYILSYGRK